VSEVQVEDSKERQPRQARLDLVSQGLPAPSARVRLSRVPTRPFRICELGAAPRGSVV